MLITGKLSSEIEWPTPRALEWGSIILLMEQDDLLNYGCLSLSPRGETTRFFFFSSLLLFSLWLTFNLFLRWGEKKPARCLISLELLMRPLSWFEGCLVCFWGKKKKKCCCRASGGFCLPRQRHKQHRRQFHLLRPAALLISLLILLPFQSGLIASQLLLERATEEMRLQPGAVCTNEIRRRESSIYAGFPLSNINVWRPTRC